MQRWRELEKKVADIAELVSLAEEDISLQAEIQSEIEKVASQLDEPSLITTVSGSVRGLKCPMMSMKAPSRGARTSATTSR